METHIAECMKLNFGGAVIDKLMDSSQDYVTDRNFQAVCCVCKAKVLNRLSTVTALMLISELCANRRMRQSFYFFLKIRFTLRLLSIAVVHQAFPCI